MFRNKKLLTIGITMILFIISVYLIYGGLNNKTAQTLEDTNESLKAEINELNQDIEKLKGLIGIYNQNIRNLNQCLDLAIYKGKEKDKVFLQNVYNFITKNKRFNNVLVFELGPVRKESESVYFVDFLALENLDTQNIFDNLDTYFPTDILKQHVIKCYIEDNSIKYEVIE